MEKLDKKFYASSMVDDFGDRIGVIRKAKDNSAVPDDEWCIFLAKDNAFARILAKYVNECANLGCDSEQMVAVVAMYKRVMEWREAHPDRCKIPDAAGERLLP
jgi:hypothetical protein